MFQVHVECSWLIARGILNNSYFEIPCEIWRTHPWWAMSYFCSMPKNCNFIKQGACFQEYFSLFLGLFLKNFLKQLSFRNVWILLKIPDHLLGFSWSSQNWNWLLSAWYWITHSHEKKEKTLKVLEPEALHLNSTKSSLSSNTFRSSSLNILSFIAY